MASSSSSSHSALVTSSRSCKFDVFLSFRGEDIRKKFVDHLHSTLKQHLIEVYKDDTKLPRGESINESLFEAIEDSRIAVVMFSKNYADSSWCLDELTHIMKRNDEKEIIVLPIFYDVEPSDVRNQKNEFGEAFAKQEEKDAKKAKIWKKALVDVSKISGWELKNTDDGHESRFIKRIVDVILNRLFVLNWSVDKNLVGMRERVDDLEKLLDIGSKGVRMVGIWGVGGGGKTTLATSVYMKIFQNFHGKCIIENVREKASKYDLNKLQENILSALFETKVEINSITEGKEKMKSMLHSRKVLVLLDDVDKIDQLEALAGEHNWFGSGSRIIITTRDEHLLKIHNVESVYSIKLLSNDEALKLFKRHAYNKENPIEYYEKLSLRAVSFASGLPLSLKLLGSFLKDKDKKEWTSALKKLEDNPEPDVMDIIKISYDGLKHNQKELFLDIACFWRWQSVHGAIEVIESCGFHPGIDIKVLTQKGLITIIHNGFGDIFDMHDLVQQMGHYVVRSEQFNNPKKHSRVWKYEDVKEMCFGDTTKENNKIEVIECCLPKSEKPSANFFKVISNMKNLRLLFVHDDGKDEVISFMEKLRLLFVSNEVEGGPNVLSNELRYIYWYNYRSSSPFPDAFQPRKLVALELHLSMQKELWRVNQCLPCLKVLHLSKMELVTTPNFNGLPCLRKLKLYSCMRLKKIHPSLENHTRLEYLNVSLCPNLKRLPPLGKMKNIKVLVISRCYLRDGVLRGIDKLCNLQELNLSGNMFSQLDFSLSQLTQLKSLNLSYCYNLLKLPELPSSLVILTAHGCSSLTLAKDFTTNICEELCQVSLTVENGWSKRLLQSMLKEKDIENGCMHLYFEGDLEIAKGFTPPLVGTGKSYRLKLPEKWCDDFSGFLVCVAFSNSVLLTVPYLDISMKQVSDLGSKDDVAWKESADHDKGSSVWYVPFDSLRHTVWWDQTYSAVSFNLEPHSDTGDLKIRGFGVRLVGKNQKISIRGVNETSSHYTCTFHTHHDSEGGVTVALYSDNTSSVFSDRFIEYTKRRREDIIREKHRYRSPSSPSVFSNKLTRILWTEGRRIWLVPIILFIWSIVTNLDQVMHPTTTWLIGRGNLLACAFLMYYYIYH